MRDALDGLIKSCDSREIKKKNKKKKIDTRGNCFFKRSSGRPSPKINTAVRLFFNERNKEARTAEEARELGNNTISGPSCSYSFSTHLTEISLGDDDDDDGRCRCTF
jgi:hypothetical protein